MNGCVDCIEIKRVSFQIKDIDLQLGAIKQAQEMKDIEHETMIQNLTTRMDTMSDDFKTLKAEVRQDIQGIRDDIPRLFENAVNKLLAKIAKWLLISMGILIAIILLAVTRPMLVKGIDELKNKIETVEVTK